MTDYVIYIALVSLVIAIGSLDYTRRSYNKSKNIFELSQVTCLLDDLHRISCLSLEYESSDLKDKISDTNIQYFNIYDRIAYALNSGTIESKETKAYIKKLFISAGNRYKRLKRKGDLPLGNNSDFKKEYEDFFEAYKKLCNEDLG